MVYHGIGRKVADVFASARTPAWERLGALAIADGQAVHAVLTATATFEADRPPGADCYFVRVDPAKQAGGGGRLVLPGQGAHGA
jgi:hypothetical protein